MSAQDGAEEPVIKLNARAPSSVFKQYGTSAFSGTPGNYLKYWVDFRGQAETQLDEDTFHSVIHVRTDPRVLQTLRTVFPFPGGNGCMLFIRTKGGDIQVQASRKPELVLADKICSQNSCFLRAEFFVLT